MTAITEPYLPYYFNDRRRGKDRRKFSYTLHIPERRIKEDRRAGSERRKIPRQIMAEFEWEDKLLHG